MNIRLYSFIQLMLVSTHTGMQVYVYASICMWVRFTYACIRIKTLNAGLLVSP